MNGGQEPGLLGGEGTVLHSGNLTRGFLEGTGGHMSPPAYERACRLPGSGQCVHARRDPVAFPVAFPQR